MNILLISILTLLLIDMILSLIIVMMDSDTWLGDGGGGFLLFFALPFVFPMWLHSQLSKKEASKQ